MELRNGLLTETAIKYEFPLLEHWLQDNGLTTPGRRSLEEAP